MASARRSTRDPPAAVDCRAIAAQWRRWRVERAAQLQAWPNRGSGRETRQAKSRATRGAAPVNIHPGSAPRFSGRAKPRTCASSLSRGPASGQRPPRSSSRANGAPPPRRQARPLAPQGDFTRGLPYPFAEFSYSLAPLMDFARSHAWQDACTSAGHVRHR